jgi:hypothetical protein
MKLVSDLEREQMLRDLEISKKEITRRIETMPISMRTDKIKAKKMELEQHLAKIDAAIAKFTDRKKTMYIELDSISEKEETISNVVQDINRKRGGGGIL